MSSNNSLLRKADLAIADLQTNGGLLNPEQGAAFIRKLIKQPTLIRLCRVVEMNAPIRKINKIGFGSRILRAATSGTALPENPQVNGGLGGRAKPTTSQIELQTKEQIAQVNIPYDVMEDNIERATTANNELPNTGPAGLRQTIIDLIAERAALDMEELGLLAASTYNNPADPDDTAYLSQFDGWLHLAETDGNVYDAGGSTINKVDLQERPEGDAEPVSAQQAGVEPLRLGEPGDGIPRHAVGSVRRAGRPDDHGQQPGLRLRLARHPGGADAGRPGPVLRPAEPDLRHPAAGRRWSSTRTLRLASTSSS